jgi:DNA replication and repair protein RecF
MTYLKSLLLFNFKNYGEKSISFSPQINCIVGENGTGKTNLLDAIHYLCLTKSAFSNTDTQQIKHGEQFFMVQGQFTRSENLFTIDCNVQTGKGKIFRKNKQEYEKISQHIGEFPCVLMMPYDTDLIREGSEMRRRFFDNMLSQSNPIYLQDLMQYNQLQKQRNAALQYFAQNNQYDADLLESYNRPLLVLNQKLFAERQKFVHLFVPLLQKFYQQIANNKEIANLTYQSDLETSNFNSLFYSNLAKDLVAQRTTLGVRKDDYIFSLHDLSVSKFGSQGQQKSYVIALRLAQTALITQQKEQTPILLLDDIFDKLDEKRITQLLQYIDSPQCGQVFITDARPERTQSLLAPLKKEVKTLVLEN